MSFFRFFSLASLPFLFFGNVVAMLTFLTEGGAEGLYGFRCVYNPAM